MVQALPSLQLLGHVDTGSQLSPSSVTPLPQLGEQSESMLALHPTGQQPSSEAQAAMSVWLQAALQFSALPVA